MKRPRKTRVLSRKTAHGRIERTILHAILGFSGAFLALISKIDFTQTNLDAETIQVIVSGALLTGLVSIAHEALNRYIDKYEGKKK